MLLELDLLEKAASPGEVLEDDMMMVDVVDGW
jgi:hypothetical protein